MADDPPLFRFTSEQGPEFEPYQKLIGRLALAWAEFEFNLNDAIWELANVERMTGTCMTSQLIGPGPRYRCLVALLRLRNTPQDIIDKINSLSSDAESLGRQRNRFLHDPMVMDTTTKKLLRMETTADRKVRHGLIPVETKEIEELSLAIDQINNAFVALYERAVAEAPPWPRTQYAQSPGIRRSRLGPGSDSSKPGHQPPPSQA